MILWQPDPVTRDLDRMCHYAGLWGVDGIELRRIGRHAERVPEINEAPVRRRIEEDELSVVISYTDIFEAEADDAAGWMNDLLRFADTLAFNARMGIRTSVVAALEGSGPLPETPYRRLTERATAAGQTVIVEDRNEDGRVEDLVRALAVPQLTRAITRPLEPGVWDGPAESIGLVRCQTAVHDLVDQEAVQTGWTTFLKGMTAGGFRGHVVLEFSGAEVGKNGLRLATALIRAARAAVRT